MTGVHNRGRKKLVKPEHVKPERLGGCLAFRVPYLQSRWVNLVFRLLLSSVVALLVLNAVAGKVQQWQETVRLQTLNTVQVQLADAGAQQQQAVQADSLTGQRDALQLQAALLEQLAELAPSMDVSGRQQQVSDQLIQLDKQIVTTYNQAVQNWSKVDNGIQALQVMNTFARLEGYADAADWKGVCRTYIRNDIARQLREGNTLTAWVEDYRLTQALYPDRITDQPVTFSAIRGSWMCREDQLELMGQTEELSAGEGRAGIRCIQAVGCRLAGGISETFPVCTEEIMFDQLIMQGGVNSIAVDEQINEDADPAACRLVLSSQLDSQSDNQSDNQSDSLSEICVLSENVIVIEEGAWSGTYYRILENS